MTIRRTGLSLSLALALMIIFASTSCDKQRVLDKYVAISDQSWELEDTCVFSFEIQDTSAFYDLFFNLRHTDEYPYSNLYVYLTITDPDGISDRKRLNFLLANKEGKWFGKGLGRYLDNRIELVRGLKFLKSGIYMVSIEQNMRDNPLKGISDVGLRLAHSE